MIGRGGSERGVGGSVGSEGMFEFPEWHVRVLCQDPPGLKSIPE